MKKIFVIFLILFWAIILSGCQKNYTNQTYTNQIYGYQFQYPWNWDILHLDPKGEYVSIINRDVLKYRNNPEIQINHLFNENEVTFFRSQEEKDQYKLQIRSGKNIFIENLKNSKYSQLSANGLYGFYLWEKDPWDWIGVPKIAFGAYIVRENDIFELAYYVPSARIDEPMWTSKNNEANEGMTDEEHEALFKQMITTFKSIK